MPHRKVILHPTDFSDSSRYAFRLAGSLARAEGACLLVLHVEQTLGPMVAYGEVLAQMEPAAYRKKLWDILRRLRVPDPNVQVEYRIVQGDAAAEILRLAEESGCDLIVMGSHGRTGLGRLLLGSVAEQVVREAPCPVVTVKIPHQVRAAGPPPTAGLTVAGQAGGAAP
jgi:nucleotide-binding universal stress UspA family protein